MSSNVVVDVNLLEDEFVLAQVSRDGRPFPLEEALILIRHTLSLRLDGSGGQEVWGVPIHGSQGLLEVGKVVVATELIICSITKQPMGYPRLIVWSLEKTQGEKNSKLKEKTQNSIKKLKDSANFGVIYSKN